MADSKKYNGSIWEHSLKKLGAGTKIITTFPTTIYADGSSATAALQGNMQQTGTPTPSNPIYPTECGDLETTGTHAGQYKTPISSAGQTTPVYLGEVQTTRKVKKLVLTGEEGWQRTSNGAYYLGGGNCPTDYKKTLRESIVMCTHYVGQISTTGSAAVQDNNISFYGGSSATYEMYIGARSISTLTAFTTYLQQQYANGTPVTVWYVLANETTGIVNEPIRKIGDYADTVSGISIPTITGADSFGVLTTLKPSEVSLAYTGWHDATVKEWDGSQWQ